MRLQWDNVMKRGTLSATNEDSNYPIERVLKNTDRSEFRATGASSVITAPLDAVESVSCLAVGNHNVDSLTVTLKDFGGSTIGGPFVYSNSDLVTVDSAGRTFNTGLVYFDRVDGVREIEYTVTGFSSPLFIGGLSPGPRLQFPDIAVRPDTGGRHTGGGTKTPAGILFDNPGFLLERFTCSLAVVTIEDSDAIDDMYEAIGIGKVVYLDRWEGLDEFRPMLANITSSNLGRIKHPGPAPLVLRNLKIEFEECR